MKKTIDYREAAISRRAKNVGLILEKGYRKYMHQGWGYVRDEHGNRIEDTSSLIMKRGSTFQYPMMTFIRTL